ncbi:DMT family transporter [Petropleomorpha daqingensis]|uniref:Drug/metabolite transporter (DMT)-like permease n=1 Tax=Petropleomorpha daqingensis TaxID=2026353 RepID=A0A853CHT6_9ACTN|nr:drug/metabolite transporter (DMT)-like permease [Petropleomorpha daqingensis]
MRGSALPVVLAVLSALSAAVYVVLQRDANRGTPSSVTGWRLVGHLLRHPLWLLGQAAWLVAFGLQALALHLGRLSVVQPVLVTELVFTLLIRRFVSHWPVRAAAWGSAVLLCGSLGVFLVAAEPRGGHPYATASAWVWALLATGGAAGGAAVLGLSGTPARRAACFATSGAVLGALEAALIKTVTGELSAGGLSAVLTNWPVYALIASGAASGVVVQAALHAGPLTVSQPLLVVLNPMVATGLSVWLFGEHFSDDPVTVALAGIAFAGVAVGVGLLTATGPRSSAVEPEPSEDALP